MVLFFYPHPHQIWATYPHQKWPGYIYTPTKNGLPPPPNLGYHPHQIWATKYSFITHKINTFSFARFLNKQDLMIFSCWTFGMHSGDASLKRPAEQGREVSFAHSWWANAQCNHAKHGALTTGRQ